MSNEVKHGQDAPITNNYSYNMIKGCEYVGQRIGNSVAVYSGSRLVEIRDYNPSDFSSTGSNK